ncbi:DUF4405 domain-containing protein [Methanobacterium formicicum]|uniref:DUF4405 domain-containing protein n=1 Tax=Methanobacterium formicicum (strain DSM 3637 / PP1) TaxID=1204725 RepID=K2RV74_METFP|nr:DUF4405 domain-containing protein [Methanobacterium formicicum]EKF86685.1 hypothetical protein A994_00325 [Methanobacterium formicicum DSM 3637]
MKKLYVVLLIVLLTPIAVYAWNDCPYGLLNDPYPGQCPRYLDTNQNNICDHSESPSSGSLNNSSITTQANENSANDKNSTNNSFSDIQQARSVPSQSYNLIPIATTTLILYLITYLLYLEDRLKRNIYYVIWKYVLMASFIVTGVTGLILTIFINYGIQSSWNLTIDFWHAEFAIIMAVSTLLHIHLYWKQVKRVFKAV